MTDDELKRARELAYTYRHSDRNVENFLRGLADEVERLKKQRDDAVAANQSAAVCATHLGEFTRDGCLVCDAESLREQFERLLGEAKKGHKHADKQTLRVGRCGLCKAIARAEEVLK